jgi:hypothetical protein
MALKAKWMAAKPHNKFPIVNRDGRNAIDLSFRRRGRRDIGSGAMFVM